MISGIVSGGLVGLAWIIGFIIYFIKRHRREQRARALGYRGHREMLDPPKKKEAFIIPPDPAIVESGLVPGERIYDDAIPEEDSPTTPTSKRSRTFSYSSLKLQTVATKDSGESTVSMPTLPSRSSAPSKIAYIKPATNSPNRSPKGYDRVPLSPLSSRGKTGSIPDSI